MGSPSKPSFAISSTMLTVTDELWIIAVSTVPIRTASIGLCRELSSCITPGLSFIPSMAPDIPLNPMKRMPKPTITSPIFSAFCLPLPSIIVSTPANNMMGAASDKLKETSWEVMVVPIFAP